MKKQYKEYLEKEKKTKEEITFLEYKKKIEEIKKTKKISTELKMKFENIVLELKSLNLSKEEITNILDKIKEIESIPDVDKYLDKKYRITPNEYKKSLTDKKQRDKTLQKLNTALNIIAQQLCSADDLLFFFTGYNILDKNIKKIQENHIDIKESLEKI